MKWKALPFPAEISPLCFCSPPSSPSCHAAVAVKTELATASKDRRRTGSATTVEITSPTLGVIGIRHLSTLAHCHREEGAVLPPCFCYHHRLRLIALLPKSPPPPPRAAGANKALPTGDSSDHRIFLAGLATHRRHRQRETPRPCVHCKRGGKEKKVETLYPSAGHCQVFCPHP